MSHCAAASGSAPGARWPLKPEPRSEPTSFSILSRLAASRGALPMARLVVAPTIAPLRATSPANAPSVERTVATPISAFSLTIFPPASVMAARAVFPLAPCS